MRLGVFGILTLMVLVFLIILNQSDLKSEDVDRVFEDIDVNTFENIDANITDINLGRFVKYSVKGLAQELHGTYYLTAWANTFLPELVTQNIQVIVILVIFAMLSPLLFYGGLTVVIIVMVLHEKFKEFRQRRKGG